MYGLIHWIFDVFDLWNYEEMTSIYFLEEEEQLMILTQEEEKNHKFLYEIF